MTDFVTIKIRNFMTMASKCFSTQKHNWTIKKRRFLDQLSRADPGATAEISIEAKVNTGDWFVVQQNVHHCRRRILVGEAALDWDVIELSILEDYF